MRYFATTLAIAAFAMPAAASVTPFTETFATDASNWTAGSFAPATWVSSGALDGSSYITAQADLNTAGPFGLTLLRGHDSADASNDMFVGNYLESGINRVEFDFRHNAGVDLDIALRIAGSSNTPGLAVETIGSTASDQWVTLSFDLFFGNPLLTLGGPPSPEFYELVMEQIGNVQVSAMRPDGLTSPLVVDFDLDNVRIVPAPSALGMLGVVGLVATRRRR